jgi:two-component system KDP operon response regulator KdpE
MAHMLIVDEDMQFCASMTRALKTHGWRTTCIYSTDRLTSALAIYQPSMVLLNVNFEADSADLDSGIAACYALRQWNNVPVIMMSTVSDEFIRIQALDVGADDFIEKPFSVNELMARVRAIQRRLERINQHSHVSYKIGDLSINLDTSTVWLGGELLHLTRKEYKLLKALVQAEGHPVAYKDLLAAVYGREGSGDKSTIRILIKQLRHKLQDVYTDPRYVMTEPGYGYRINMTSPAMDNTA